MRTRILVTFPHGFDGSVKFMDADNHDFVVDPRFVIRCLSQGTLVLSQSSIDVGITDEVYRIPFIKSETWLLESPEEKEDE